MSQLAPDSTAPAPQEPETTAAAAVDNAAFTPMMAQYFAIKNEHRDSLLFFRMGDFYELFFDDAVKAAETLGIALTKRGKHLGEDIPMCGVPVHAAEDYLQRLIRAGHRVAVCEQMEDPAEAKKRGSKSVVQRAVIRLVTPGTLTEDSLLDSRRHNYLAALTRMRGGDELALAWIDISTGDFATCAVTGATLMAELARLDPGEIILADGLLAEPELAAGLRQMRAALTPLPSARFDSTNAEKRLKSHFGVGALDGFGAFSRAEIAAAGSLLDYVMLTQVGKVPLIRRPVCHQQTDIMLIDAATRTNLELVRTTSGERRGSLLAAIDRTVTNAGSRLLAERLAAPLTNAGLVNQRLDAVTFFLDVERVRADVRASLKAAPDFARALSRLSVGRGGPRDLAAVGAGLRAAGEILELLQRDTGLVSVPDEVQAIIAKLAQNDGVIAERLAATLRDELPLMARDGGLVRPGYSTDLDEQLRLRDESRQVIAGLQGDYAEATGIKTLKIRHNNVLGFFIEVTAQHGERLMPPAHGGRFIHRQSLANAMRFTTVELSELESRIARAADRALRIELEIFDELVAMVLAQSSVIAEIADALAELDVATALAQLAEDERLTRPVVDDSRAFEIVGGRHPVVEMALRQTGDGTFVPNDCNLSAEGEGRHIWLVTGPNMAGKSTFLRQNALIAVMAQMGSYVPAGSAHIGVVDRLFSRVGAADDLARGRSTFMVEMVETATILNQAGPRSLVILDEIGRGTATFDGLSIAWACVEHLHEVNRCRALFTTHFHELTALADRLSRLANATMKVREFNGELVFLHEVGPGAADRSYGIQVAKLAGLPPAVIQRASEVLHLLETTEQASARRDLVDDLPLFAVAARATPPPAETPGLAEPSPLASELVAAVRDLDPDNLSPREALDTLYRLKGLLTS